jgi:hypothetical protein
MTHLRLVTWRPADTPRAPAASLPRRLVAAVLRNASGALARLAQHVAEPTARAPASLPQTLEFYADASAPEGALYVDGRLIGHLPGVKRL